MEALAYFFEQSIAMVVFEDEPMDGVLEGVVSNFPRKKFTIKTDKLAAILGVASRFGSLANFAAGMWHPFIAKHLLWACDAQESTNDQSRDVVEANWKPRHPTWSWISVDYPVYHVMPAGVSELRSCCEILNFDDLCTPDFAVYRCNEENLGLRVKGAVLKLESPAGWIDAASSLLPTRLANHWNDFCARLPIGSWLSNWK